MVLTEDVIGEVLSVSDTLYRFVALKAVVEGSNCTSRPHAVLRGLLVPRDLAYLKIFKKPDAHAGCRSASYDEE